MKIKYFLILLPATLIVAAFSGGCDQAEPESPLPPVIEPSQPEFSTPAEPESPPPPVTEPSQPEFSTPEKSPHWESNTPEHGATLATVPVNVVIDFNFDLGPGSDISIMSNSKEYATSETIIDENKLAMRRNMDPNAPDGLYRVTYKACWPDGSCHDGHFEFVINRGRIDDYTDLRGNKEVSIKMEGIAFTPQHIIISKGTKITWTNEDSVTHYVNTDSHPAHTYFPEMNSKALNSGDTHSLTLDIPGVYPYHCSAHTNMKGSIVAEENHEK